MREPDPFVLLIRCRAVGCRELPDDLGPVIIGTPKDVGTP